MEIATKKARSRGKSSMMLLYHPVRTLVQVSVCLSVYECTP
jgi:hypothetical protein